MVVGDFNPFTDEEIEILCKTLNLKDARYAGVSWNAPGNRFYDGHRKNPGKRLDRVLFSRRVWAETHLVGQGKIFFEGEEFSFSDHGGLFAYVDVCAAYASRAKGDLAAMGRRRADLVGLREQSQQQELEYVQGKRQEGRDEQALAKQRAWETNREELRSAQMRGAKMRRDRRESLWRNAFGAGSLLDAAIVTRAALGGCVPSAPCDVGIVALNDMRRGSWETLSRLPLRGLVCRGSTSYVNCLAQVLMRVPTVLEWLIRHSKDGCDLGDRTRVLCALFRTYCQLVDGSVNQQSCVPILAERRGSVSQRFADCQGHCVVDFFSRNFLLLRACVKSRRAGLVCGMGCRWVKLW